MNNALLVALALLIAAGAALLLLTRGDSRLPDLPFDSAQVSEIVKMKIIQRQTRAVPGLDGGVRVQIGDITGGRTALTVSRADGETLVGTTSVRKGDAVEFVAGGRRYTLSVLEMENFLAGDDYVVLEIAEEGARGEAPVDERDRIEALLRKVAAADIVCIRNGKEHTSAEAARHLRRKWPAEIKTLEEFIDRIASRSSLSGKPYRIRLRDGTVLEAREWLRRLAEE